MPYAPPLVKPPLPPLRPPVAPPFRPPGTNRLPPTQTAPIFSPPTLLPPTDRDLQGVVCIYANTPLWEPKKIRYRYPGESWQEIEGDRYTFSPSNIDNFNGIPGVRYYFYLRGTNWNNVQRSTNPGRLGPLFGQNGPVSIGRVSGYGVAPRTPAWAVGIMYGNGLNSLTLTRETQQLPNDTNNVFQFGTTHIWKVVRVDTGEEIPPKCVFKVFGVFNQEILSITRDVCPEVIVVPERCYYKAENERLVRKVNVGIFQNLRTEYNGNCATVWLDAPPLQFSTEIYKECSDNPSCPPPRIKFDKKCEEKCEQCPPGTAIKVLLGGNIACVDAVGCVLKTVKYKPGCNNYDCICS